MMSTQVLLDMVHIECAHRLFAEYRGYREVLDSGEYCWLGGCFGY